MNTNESFEKTFQRMIALEEELKTVSEQYSIYLARVALKYHVEIRNKLSELRASSFHNILSDEDNTIGFIPEEFNWVYWNWDDYLSNDDGKVTAFLNPNTMDITLKVDVKLHNKVAVNTITCNIPPKYYIPSMSKVLVNVKKDYFKYVKQSYNDKILENEKKSKDTKNKISELNREIKTRTPRRTFFFTKSDKEI